MICSLNNLFEKFHDTTSTSVVHTLTSGIFRNLRPWHKQMLIKREKSVQWTDELVIQCSEFRIANGEETDQRYSDWLLHKSHVKVWWIIHLTFPAFHYVPAWECGLCLEVSIIITILIYMLPPLSITTLKSRYISHILQMRKLRLRKMGFVAEHESSSRLTWLCVSPGSTFHYPLCSQMHTSVSWHLWW